MASKFVGTLKSFQKEGVEFALRTPFHICNFEAGLGKTITSLAVACELNVPVLIVVPAFLKDNWENEIARFTQGLNYQIVSYSMISKTNLINFKFVIADECHYLKNKDAKRTQAFFRVLEAFRPTHFMGLSGTPVLNRVPELWTLLSLCHLSGKYDAFNPFARLYYKFCNTFSFERSFEVNRVIVKRFEGVKNKEKLKELLRPVWIRRTAAKCLDLPESTEIEIMGNLKKFDEDLRAAYELFQKDPDDIAYATKKSDLALAKTKATIQHADELIEQGKRPIIYTCHVRSALALADHFKCEVITGAVKSELRQGIVDRFNTGTPCALVLTVGAASTGFNITSTNYMIFNDFDFVPANMEQARRRMQRIGQTLPCFYYYIFASELDKKIYQAVKRKERDITKIYS